MPARRHLPISHVCRQLSLVTFGGQDAGAQHSEALHLLEEIRPILNGKYLEYRVTAEDAMALAKPYTYTRYFEKVKAEIKEDVCEDEE